MNNPYNSGEAYVNPVTLRPVLEEGCKYEPITPCPWVDTKDTEVMITKDNLCILDTCKIMSSLTQIADANPPAPVTPVTIPTANVFTSNTAAITAGFKPGQLYYTSITGDTAIAY